MKKVFLFAGVAAMAMTSCSNDIDFGGSSEGGKLQVSADIDEVRTRASGTSWDANDAIGVSEEGSSTNTNVKFVTANGDGKFTSDQSFYLLGDESHTIKAYYPYSEDVASGSTTITFTEPTDFMYGTATATRQSPEAKLVFKHQMSQVSFTLSDPAATKADATSSEAVVTLHNIVKGGTFDTTTGTVTPGSTTEDYKITTTMGSKASFILPPQTFTDNKVLVSVKYNDKTYSATISLDKSTQGSDTQYTLAVSKDTESTNLVVSSETITDWTPIDKGNVDMTEQEVPNTLEIGDFLLSDGSVVDKDYDLNKLTTDKTVVGVVYYVGNAQPSVLYSGTYTEAQDIMKAEAPNATNGLAIAIKNGNDGAVARMFGNVKFDYATWYNADGNTDVASYIVKTFNLSKPSTQFLGYNNTAVIEKVGNTYNDKETGASQFTDILSSFRDANTVSGDVSKWYLPSYAELKQIQDNYSTISASITKAGGTLEQFTDFTANTTKKFYWSSDLRSGQYTWISPLAETIDQDLLYITRISNSYEGYFRFAIAF